MKFIWRYLRRQLSRAGLGVTLKFLGTVCELLIPYILEHMVDRVVPLGQFRPVVFWGLMMVAVAFVARQTHVTANGMAAAVARDCIQEVRQDLFDGTLRLSGAQVDRFGIPSLISRMTSDSYNVQNFIRAIQSMGIRAPIMLVGGIMVTLSMDAKLASILCVMAPILIVLVTTVSMKGIPLYEKVQRRLDDVVRVMRENITGIRVVKALSKTEYEKDRFGGVNGKLTDSELTAGVVMAVPGPTVQFFLNVGLVLVVLLGARRVDSGLMKPGVILAFLTYFTMILQSVMALNRFFIMMSKATASAQRIAEVVDTVNDQPVLPLTEEHVREDAPFILFDHVSFTHDSTTAAARTQAFAGEGRGKCLDDITFSLEKGQTLGIIGATGSGKTTIINLLMRFYDADEGGVYLDGRDVRTYPKDELHRRFGVVFQNDAIFADSLKDNISLGRDVTDEDVRRAARDAMAEEFILQKPGEFDYMADIKGANLSGGQKQRILISRALAAEPEVLILDDATSALDYRTDASLRKHIREGYENVTSIIVAQRVSSILAADRILVLEDGRIIGSGTHQQLLDSCPTYRDIYESQMGELD